MAANLYFLYCPKNTLLRGLWGELGEKVLNTLEEVGIYTYGQLLEYAKHNDFSDLPGIGAHTAERIRRFIEFVEDANKQEIVHMFFEMSKRFPSMKGVAEEHIRRKKAHNDASRDYF